MVELVEENRSREEGDVQPVKTASKSSDVKSNFSFRGLQVLTCYLFLEGRS